VSKILGHTFHIPVMGTGHSIDTPIRVAHLGISSVISIIDDVLIEKLREHYCGKFGLPYERILRFSPDARARRITQYLDAVQEIVRRKMEEVKSLPFFRNNDKDRYFSLLPETSELKEKYDRLRTMPEGPERRAFAASLTESMQPGAIDVNIMTKLDRINVDRSGKPMSEEYSDAKAALRGFANSSLRSAVEFSAGLNQRLFSYTSEFREFYRNETGELKKSIVLKVSDFRSALVQGKILAKKGLEVREFRIESGLNCGGHAFASNGHLLPALLKEFRDKRDQLKAECLPLVQDFYETMGWHYPEHAVHELPIVTVQGGIGTNGEDTRLREQFGMDRTGWATPFLLVPEATCVDDATRELLKQATEKDCYLSDVSPLGVSFNNVQGTGSAIWTQKQAQDGRPGSPCPKGYLAFNTEFTGTPICTASREYQAEKLKLLSSLPPDEQAKASSVESVTSKTCICDHLGNGALISLGIAKPSNSPQAICPGPNIAWFDRVYNLSEMVDHIYGRGPSLVPGERPHMFAKEIVMAVDYFEGLLAKSAFSKRDIAGLREYRQNLETGMDFCMSVARETPYPNENLASIPPCVEEQRARLRRLAERLVQPDTV
jgi:hypothetical protein